MKLLVTCGHLVRHIGEYHTLLKKNGIEYKCLNPTNQQFSDQEMLQILPNNDFIIAGDDEISEKVIEKSFFYGLKAIIKWGIGVDNIDKMAAKKYGIPVFNTPDVFGSEVAEQALSFILNLSRATHIIDTQVRKGNWYKYEGNSLRGKNIGIIGFGSIGKAIAKRCLAFEMNVSFYDPFLNQNNAEENLFQNIEFDKLCETSDFIVLACSLNKDNKFIINHKSISKMIKKPYIINVSRGHLIKEDDLISALKEKRIKGAGLDVFNIEPLPINSEFINFKECILGSHNSSNTLEAVKRVNKMTIDMVIKISESDVSKVYKERRII